MKKGAYTADGYIVQREEARRNVSSVDVLAAVVTGRYARGKGGGGEGGD